MPAIRQTTVPSEAQQERDDALLISMNKCAQRLGVNRSYLYSAFIATGRIKTISLGRRRLVYAPDLDAFVRELAEEQGVKLSPPPAAL